MDPTADTVASDETGASSYDSVLRELARPPIADDGALPAALSPGVLVADRFEVVREIGRGGFARVVEARDHVLSRPVALKLLRRRLRGRELELFYREAQATARLNHAHIVTAHDWGQWDGVPFLVLELLRGETLAARLARGPIREEAAWAIARDIVRALVYAHGEGVLHLDLKSQNVWLLEDGRVKVLDFGLAGLEWKEDEVPGGLARVRGGTPGAMAPEQAEGGATDARTDVWAVGVMLHEMLFGRMPEPLAPEAAEIPLPRHPAARRARAVLGRTLARDPAARFPDPGALLAAIERAARARRVRRVRLIAASAIAAASAAAVVIAATGTRGGDDPAAVVAPAPSQHRQLTFSGDVNQAELSPTGDAFAYTTNERRELWVREIDSDEPRRLLVSEVLLRPRWFPDGQRILVPAERPTSPVLWVVSRRGGDARAVRMRRTHNVVLSDGVTIASILDGHPVRQHIVLSAVGADPNRGASIAMPAGVNFVVDIDATTDGRFLVPTYDGHGRLWTASAGSAPRILETVDDWILGARWDADGAGVFFVQGEGRNSALRWLRLDRGRSSRTATLFAGVPIGDAISASRDGGRLLYHRETPSTTLVRIGRDGKETPLTRGTAQHGTPVVSADGQTLMYSVREDRSSAIVVGSLDPAAPRHRIARCPNACTSPVWSPDGHRVAFVREDPGGWRIVVVSSDGSGERVLEQSRPTDQEFKSLEWVSSREIVYTPLLNQALRLIDVDTGVDRPFLTGPTPGWMFAATRSPDGSRVAWYWNRSGKAHWGVYVADASGRDARRVVDQPRQPLAWTEDGQALIVSIEDENGINAVERRDLASDRVVRLWTREGEFKVLEVAPVPHTADLILVKDTTRSDAWLIEDPVGRRARLAQ